MKKIFTLAFIAIAVLLATPANAQVKFGLKAGVNVSDLHLSNVSENFDKSNNAGGFIGPTIKFTLPVVGLSLDASALYDYKSSKVKNTEGNVTTEETVKQQTIDIPINVRYGVGLGSTANLFLYAGPQWAFNVGDKDFNWQTLTESSTYSLRSTNFSVNVGVGATALKHLQLTVNYNIACGKTADLTVKDAANTIIKGKGRNNSWQIALAYFF